MAPVSITATRLLGTNNVCKQKIIFNIGINQ